MAHYAIGAIVYAENAEDAKRQAADVFDKISGEDMPFDYYNVFDDGIFRARSKEGQEAIEELMAATKGRFMMHLRELRAALANMSDEQAYESDDMILRYPAYKIGAYEGTAIHLYDLNGNGIRKPNDLREALTQDYKPMSPVEEGPMDWWPEDVDPPWAENAWIVLADAHS